MSNKNLINSFMVQKIFIPISNALTIIRFISPLIAFIPVKKAFLRVYKPSHMYLEYPDFVSSSFLSSYN